MDGQEVNPEHSSADVMLSVYCCVNDAFSSVESII